MDSIKLLTELAEASKGSRQLDAAIAKALGENIKWVGVNKNILIQVRSRYPASKRVAHWTTSISRALTLIPKDWLWRLQFNGRNYCLTMHKNIKIGEYAEAEASSPELAICRTVILALSQGLEKE